jgi:hypothetical protein
VTLPIADWLTSLDEMEGVLGKTLEALDRYEQTCAGWLTEPTREDPGPANLVRLEDRLEQWDTRLASAAELVATIRDDLDGHEASLTGWQDRLVAWRGLIEQR